jgi:tetrahydromethanopterin S-methyltransferase subunit E
MRRLIASAVLALATLATGAIPAYATSDQFGMIWLNGMEVRTLVVSSPLPQGGIDAFYRVPGTGGVAAVGPSTGDYHGGAWKVFDVSWTVAPYPLTSAEAVLAAAAAGKVTITRNADADFRCPIQP